MTGHKVKGKKGKKGKNVKAVYTDIVAIETATIAHVIDYLSEGGIKAVSVHDGIYLQRDSRAISEDALKKVFFAKLDAPKEKSLVEYWIELQLLQTLTA